MSAHAYAIQHNLRVEPQPSERRLTSHPARAASIDRRARVERACLAVMPEVSRHRSSLGEYAARLYAAVAT